MSNKDRRKKRQAEQAANAAGKSNVATTNQSQSSAVTATKQNAAATTKGGGTTKSNGADSKTARTNKKAEQSSLGERLLGVITLKPAIYREIAHDPAATAQGAIIAVIAALIAAALAYYGAHLAIPGTTDAFPKNVLGRSIVTFIMELAFWGLGSVVIAGVARNLFQGKTDIPEMLRVLGFSRIFQVLLFLGVLGSPIFAVASIAGLVLSIIATVIGIREAANFTTGRAAIVGVFSLVLVYVAITFFTMFVLNPIVGLLLPT